MRRFIEFVVRFKNYIALSALVVMSFALMSFGNLAQLGGFRAVVVGSIGWMQSLFAWIPNPVALKSENTALRELNLQLSVEAARTRQAMVENSTLRTYLELPEKIDYSLIAADVIGKTTTQLRNYATLNKGTAEGVHEGMCCITDAGLVGVVIGASQHFAVVQLLLNRDTRISSKVHRSRVDGIIQWDGESYLSLKNVPRTFDVKPNDLIVTSEYSSKFPPLVVIGRVRSVSDENNSLFKNVVVDPAVNFVTLEQVFVVNYIPIDERISLEKKTNDENRGKSNE
ncbi:MAG: rod shape-determining protein MreC [Ignavibacteria bacterium]|nr:rod shape-determining protein MreC [Ignavibacteria bacterium]